MATLRTKDGRSAPVNDGDSIIKACEGFGVPFGCYQGICGACKIDIISGESNLSELTDREKEMDRDSKHRLACQTKILKGEVTISF